MDIIEIVNKKIKVDTDKEVGNRIKKLLEKNKLTQKEFAEILDTTEATLSRYISGHRKPTGDTLIKMAHVLETSTDYILTGKTSLEADLDANSDTNLDANLDANYVDLSKAPLLDIIGSVRAGAGGIAQQEIIGKEIAFIPNSNPNEHFYLKVKGNSMEPRILEGDLALVKKQNDIESGDLAIVIVNDEEGVIKKVIKKPTSIELHSFNPYYPTRVFIGEEMNSIKIVGKVIKIISSW